MLNDIQDTFLLEFDPTHGRKEVSGYRPYFLGSIITSSENGGKKPLIDGQQRLTSIFLLLSFLEKYRKDKSITNVTDLANLLGNLNYGVMEYRIEFSDSRRRLFNEYLKDVSHDTAMTTVEALTDLDEGDKKIVEALHATAKELDDLVKDNIAFFIDYLVEKVFLIDISVSMETEAHRVFVTMNDRGLRLGPIDLLKGRILSYILDPSDNQTCHRKWLDTVARLKKIDPEEDSLFFRTMFRARWAKTIRGKAKGSPAGDFDIIGEAYHRWFVENTAQIGISNSDGYLKFASEEVPHYADAYYFIRENELELKSGFESLYYNAIRKYTLQPMVLLACVSPNDTTAEWQSKIRLVSKYLDLIMTSRIMERKENNYDNLKYISVQLVNDLRGKDFASLQAYIRNEWDKYSPSIKLLSKMKYEYSDRSDLLYILARIADHLELSFSLTNKVGFTTYWQRDRSGKTFDIEHLFKESYDPASLPSNHNFKDGQEYLSERNLIGALILLPRSRNRSLQDKSYKEKLAAYSTENVLAQSLCDAFFQNNPAVTGYLSQRPSLGLSPIADFTKDDIALRSEVYIKLAEEIWQKP